MLTPHNWLLGLRRFAADRRAGPAAEFALILPLAILLLFSAVEAARLVYDYHTVTKSLRKAVRYLSRIPITCNSPGQQTVTTVFTTQELTNAENLALTGKVDNPPTDFLIGYWTNINMASALEVECKTNTPTDFAGLYEGLPLIPMIKLRTAVSFPLLHGTLVFSGPTYTMVIEHNEVSMLG